MFKSFIGCALSLLALNVVPAHASSWNSVAVGSRDSAYYFDADTVEKTKGVVTVWVKTVQYTKANPDGSQAMAMRWKFNCAKKTIQTLASSTYDADGKFIRSMQGPWEADVVYPDSVGEAMLNISCETNFPTNKPSYKYFKIESNDVFQATKNYAEMMKKVTDTAPQ